MQMLPAAKEGLQDPFIMFAIIVTIATSTSKFVMCLCEVIIHLTYYRAQNKE